MTDYSGESERRLKSAIHYSDAVDKFVRVCDQLTTFRVTDLVADQMLQFRHGEVNSMHKRSQTGS